MSQTMTGDSRRVGGDGLKDRRQELVEAAVRSIAECGFEGLRLRLVAADVGIDHSTVHHYFATKEDLVAAVLVHVTDQLTTTMPSGNSPERRLRRHLDSLAALMSERPQLFTVAAELDLRSRRDDRLRAKIELDEAGWRSALGALLRSGHESGAWAPGLDPVAGVELIIAVVKGARLSPSRAGVSLTHLSQLMIAADRFPATNPTAKRGD